MCWFQVLDQSQSKRLYISDNAEDEEGSELSTSAEIPPLSEFLLSAADILSLKLSAKLVVVSFKISALIYSNMFIVLGQFIAYKRSARLGNFRWFSSFSQSLPSSWSSSCFGFFMACPRYCNKNFAESFLLGLASRNKSSKSFGRGHANCTTHKTFRASCKLGWILLGRRQC